MHASIKIRLRAHAYSDQNGGKPAQRSVVLLPGLGNNSQDYAPMAETLRERGLHVQTAAVARPDWYYNVQAYLQKSAIDSYLNLIRSYQRSQAGHGFVQVAQCCRSQATGVLDRQAAAPASGGLVLHRSFVASQFESFLPWLRGRSR